MEQYHLPEAPAATYEARRKKLLEQVGKGLVMIDAAGVSPDPVLWDRNLAYLTGYTGRNAVLLLSPEGVNVEFRETLSGPELGQGRKVHSILFIEPQRPEDAFMEGAMPTLDEIKAQTGVDRVFPLDKLTGTLERSLMLVDTVWFNTTSTPSLTKPPTEAEMLQQRIRERFYWLEFRNVAPLVHQMRWVKDDYEMACLCEAFSIQSEIFSEMMRSLKPGTNESLGQAVFEYGVKTRPEAVGYGMNTYEATVIVGSGPNSAIPHHLKNNRTIEDGDLVLIDSGVSVHGYASDITRTFPANGEFTPRQRELYAIVLEAEDAAIATMKPGSTMLEAHQAAYDVFERYGLAQYGYGNCGHPVGLNIHDANGRYPGDREQPFEPGVVIVIEPFLMLPHEGFGIRVEDGVLITPDGHELMPGPARTIEEIEALCRQS